jgi:hypothetical protein
VYFRSGCLLDSPPVKKVVGVFVTFFIAPLRPLVTVFGNIVCETVSAESDSVTCL